MTRHIFLTLLLVLPFTGHAADWMARLADTTRVCRLLIPGTHDAATGDGFIPADTLLGRKAAQTQDKNIAEQWQAGIRAFDLRPAVRTGADGKESLHLYHGEFATTRSFDSVMRQIADSVAAHPTEFAIILMRHEASPSRNETNWAALMRQSLDRVGGVLAAFRPGLTVADLRGRILVISRDTYGDVPRGGYAGGWSHSKHLADQCKAWIKGENPSDKARLMVQDFYDTSLPDGIRDKRVAIRTLFSRKKRTDMITPNACVWMINHTSGYSLTANGPGGEPVSLSHGYRDNASHTNPLVLGSLRSATELSGIVLMDFAATDNSCGYNVMGKTLVEKIIERCCNPVRPSANQPQWQKR